MVYRPRNAQDPATAPHFCPSLAKFCRELAWTLTSPPPPVFFYRMRARAMAIIVAVVSLLALAMGPTAWALGACAKPTMPSCCCAKMHSKHCCGMAPAKKDGSLPLPPDRTPSTSLTTHVPAAEWTEILSLLQPPSSGEELSTSALRDFIPEHSPPVLSRSCILLI